VSEISNPAPPANTRPAVVTASSYLLYLVAALQLIGVIATFAVFSDIRDVYQEAFADTDVPEGTAEFAAFSALIGVIFGVILAIGLAVLALFNSRGKNASRITTWVVGGIYLCCSGLSLLGSAVGSAVSPGSSGGTDMPTQEEIQALLDERLPSWYQPFSVASTVITVLALLVALILLALPAANAYFRKPQQVWEPPVPGAPYPTPPGQGVPPYPPGPTPPAGGPTQPPTPPSGGPTPPSSGGPQPPQPPAS